uniref:BTB domain-containing protein n=1 Tax=Clastoptera arizonana TaxID=38151 RepID=A0A1B6DYH4_9HEMI
MTALAENYQLKWHSHGIHLHSSISTLHRSEAFTDVTLATADGRYIQAHRFILSACSSYFHQIFIVSSKASSLSSTIIIVLPNEISYSTLSVLLQYMYSGETTVSNEQLNSVLKAGEILKIKGLCQNTEDKQKLGGILSQHNRKGIINGDVEKKNKSETNHLKESRLVLKGTENHPVLNKKSKLEDKGSFENNEQKDKSDEKEKSKKDKTDKKTENIISIEENMQIELMVKEEPLEWDDRDDEPEMENLITEMTIKPEVVSEGEEELGQYYAPLTCDLCHETFTTPALWVRHVESHPTNDLPQPRERNPDDDSSEFPPLRCELCQEVYHNPAEWVKHIQSAHTEEQLALSNNSTYGPNVVKRQYRRSCPICSKSFPSRASMLIHSRTHTGERPYICVMCSKGFNVKSNFLRHMRTLHNQIISAGMVQYSLKFKGK